MITLSSVTPSDLPYIADLWNETFQKNFPLAQRLLKQCFADPYHECESHLIAKKADVIVGWIMAKSNCAVGPELSTYKGKGGIGAIVVREGHRREGIASLMMDRVEEILGQRGSSCSTTYYPYHLLPGIPAECSAAISLFAKRGYQLTRECVDLRRSLKDYEMPASVTTTLSRNPGVTIRAATQRDGNELLEFVRREFSDGWTYNSKLHFCQGGDPADFIIAIEQDEIIGFCRIADWRTPWLIPSTHWHGLLGDRFGGLGPVGIAAKARKRGLGLAITAIAVGHLKERGVADMAIDWTNLTAFYEKLGFRVWKNYVQGEQAS